MAILFPTLHSSKQQAQAILCASNVKQLLMGLFSYENENHILPNGFDKQPGQGPPPGGFAGDSAQDKRGWWWFNFIEGFYEKSNSVTTVVTCPSKRLNDKRLMENILCSNYGANQSICKSSSQGEPTDPEFVGTPLRSSDIPRPAETLLIVDSGYAMINWWHATDEPPVILGNHKIEYTSYIPGLWINKDRALWPGLEEDARYGRHLNKTVNVGFVDGHVSRKKADDLCVEETNGEYKNRSPLWLSK
ncbi:MAG: hypothetical protein PHY02_03515 [Phycisphaerae bacterium]|nr:hypothetical protein [Phycisphaerae bacterium]